MKKLLSPFLPFTLLLSLFLLTGCGNEKKDEIDVVESPEIVAVEFFNAIYNEKNIDKAAAVCVPKLARVILSYQTAQAVGRHVFNMSYDKVDVKADDSGVKIREQFKDKAKIIVYFDGFYNEKRIKEVKRLSLVQIDGKWSIDKILKDPF